MNYIGFCHARGPIPNLKYQRAKKINFLACVHGGIVHEKAARVKKIKKDWRMHKRERKILDLKLSVSYSLCSFVVRFY